jgi:hypothetical protein
LDVSAIALESTLEIGHDVFALPRPLEQHMEIVGLLAQRFGQGAVVFEPAPALLRFLRVRRVFPEVRRRDRGFDFRQLAVQASFVKAPSAGRWLGP